MRGCKRFVKLIDLPLSRGRAECTNVRQKLSAGSIARRILHLVSMGRIYCSGLSREVIVRMKHQNM